MRLLRATLALLIVLCTATPAFAGGTASLVEMLFKQAETSGRASVELTTGNSRVIQGVTCFNDTSVLQRLIRNINDVPTGTASAPSRWRNPIQFSRARGTFNETVGQDHALTAAEFAAYQASGELPGRLASSQVLRVKLERVQSTLDELKSKAWASSPANGNTIEGPTARKFEQTFVLLRQLDEQIQDVQTFARASGFSGEAVAALDGALGEAAGTALNYTHNHAAVFGYGPVAVGFGSSPARETIEAGLESQGHLADLARARSPEALTMSDLIENL